MTISFSCPECAKRYAVDQALAGKRTKCKKCGHAMTVPAAAAPAAAAFDPYGLDEDAPRAAARPEPAGYGLAERPASRPAAQGEEDAPPIPRRAGPSKKKKSKARGGSGGFSFSGRGGAGVSLGGLLMVGFFVLRVAAGLGYGFGLTGRSEVERYAETNLAAMEELTSIFGTVHDQLTAHNAIPKATAVLDRLLASTQKVKDKKARKSDLEAVRRKYEGRFAAAKDAFGREMQRVQAIPGGTVLLMAIQGPATQLAVLEADAGAPG